MSKAVLRPATIKDIPEMLNIYGPFVSDTTVTAEYEVPSKQEFTKRLNEYTQKTPWLVCEIDGQIAGYAYASPHRTRAAYQWSAETSIYVNPSFHRSGIATALYSALFSLLHIQGYYNIYVGITCPNPKSFSLHSSMGFEKSGTYHNSMFKFGEWHDVIWMGKSLRAHNDIPQKIITYEAIKYSEVFNEVLEKYQKNIRIK